MTFDEALGAEVKAARIRARLRQVDLAAKTKISQPRISKIESGKTSALAAELVAIGDATNRDAASLLPESNAYAVGGI